MLHTFGCSITQGFALPDVVKPICDSTGKALTKEQLIAAGIKVNWEDIHVYEPSAYAWPALLADKLGVKVANYARRGACFQQIARQAAVNQSSIKPDDTVIVAWTYLSRLSFQWPARTSVPFANLVDTDWGWRTRILPGFNKFFGLSKSTVDTITADEHIYTFIQESAVTTLDPMAMYNRMYNSMVLQVAVDGLLRATGARVIHLSIEPDTCGRQLELARMELDASLREPYVIPHPDTWYQLDIDHDSCLKLHDPSIPPAENDMHPSVTHHKNFAELIYTRYFS